MGQVSYNPEMKIMAFLLFFGMSVLALADSFPVASGVERELIVCDSEIGRLVTRYRGAQVNNWKSSQTGGEVFFFQQTPPESGEVHGGVPICWPWFGAAPQPGLPKHGLARYAEWRLIRRHEQSGVELECCSSDTTRRLWPHDFQLTLLVHSLSSYELELVFTEKNTGKRPFEAAWGFHPYFAVSNACDVAIDGVSQGRPYVRKALKAVTRTRALDDKSGRRVISVWCSDNEDWMDWNPGVEKTPLCQTLGPDEWKRFFCVEPCTLTPRILGPGQKRTHRMKISVRARHVWGTD